ncbi:carbonate dehydratase [Pacificimonas flava]|uniref:Carbonic anhydrase n=2 Tax=Pacificimonas TaxID=1960290 RepID=A0A219B9M4_9SPHN|nr:MULTISPECIES: carbonic anhydrase [Pacificimonas]MBZ6379958.1 carbonic anhydrase [Pacificimonas aurantium]OWV34478.1 carbonate dehydratase [Pacificimonas flava]
MVAFTELLSGYGRFRNAAYLDQKARYDQLAEGQSPGTMVISCSDSRVSPSLIFDAGPGEIFMVRNVANLVPPFETGGGQHGVSAALEFAVTQLQVRDLLVLGHGGCGGCGAALSRQFHGSDPGKGYFIASWIGLLDEARNAVEARCNDLNGPEAQLAMEHEAVRTSLRNLRTFPFVEDRLADGRLTLHGGHFAVAHGRLSILQDSGEFEDINLS